MLVFVHTNNTRKNYKKKVLLAISIFYNLNMEKIDIEYYESGKDILLIITGIGGTTKGYKNKYERSQEM